MKNYQLNTIVPVGTKVVRTESSEILTEGKVYTVSESMKGCISLQGEDGHFLIDCFAPYEEPELEDTSTLPVYVTLKDMPYISKGSVIVEQKNGYIINQLNDDYSNSPSHVIEYLNWLLKEHPEDFKKIN